jgi:hypothetical protein
MLVNSPSMKDVYSIAGNAGTLTDEREHEVSTTYARVPIESVGERATTRLDTLLFTVRSWSADQPIAKVTWG